MGKRLPQYLFVFVILFFVMYPQAPAYCAEDRVYGRVLKNDVLLYKDDSMSEENVYFTLPYSYYVVILNPDGEDDCYQVEYQEYSGGYSKIIGYVRKEDLTVWEDPSEPLYPSILATAKQGAICTRGRTAPRKSRS